MEPVEPLLNIRPLGLSRVSESGVGWERFGWESCSARFDLVLVRPARPPLLRDLERLRNMLDCPPPPPPRPLGVRLESSRSSLVSVWSCAGPAVDLLPDLDPPLPRGLPDLLLSDCSRARLDVVLARFDLDLLRDLGPPNRLG